MDYLQKERRGSDHTIRCYKSDLNQMQRYMMEAYEVEDLTAIESEWIRSWVVELVKAGKSPRTIHRKVSVYRTFVKYARRQGIMTTNPAESVVLPKVEKRMPEVVPEHAMNQLFAEEVFATDWKGRRDRSMMALLYETGIRMSELIGLKVGDVNGARKELRVYGKGRKERVLPLLPSTLESIMQHVMDRPVGGDDLFVTDAGSSLYPSFVYRRVNHYLGEVSSLQQCSPHVLRHTFATHLLNRGAELAAVKDLLGHASLSSTQVYTQHTTARLKEFHNASPLNKRATGE
ncbi:MAG: tyrosine-type recombinase/integrase [Flavobacteriales bacterium]